MFFGKRRKRKPEQRAPAEFGGDDFGFDEPDEPRTKAPRRPKKEVELDEDTDASSVSSVSEARTLDDATFVGRGVGAPSATPRERDEPPPLRSSGEDEEEYADATRVIGPPVDARTMVVAWLVAASGPSRGRDTRLSSRPTRVGSAPDADIRLTGDPYVSTQHAELRVEGEEVFVRDLGSTNGTYRNDERIRQSALRDGDRVRFGLSEFVFKSVRL